VAGESTQSLASSRRSGIIDNFFASSHQPSPMEKPGRLLVSAKSHAPTLRPNLDYSVSCVVCRDEERPIHKTAKLGCGHRMCNPCLKRNFKLSITDPQNMPPKCCTADIPIKHVESLFDTNFKRTWNQKLAEYSTRNRIYCPSRRCGEWIKPDDIRREDGRKCGRCSRCNTKVCCACNGKWHYSRDCPRDEETNQFLEQAKREGWQRCHRCKAMVELKEGCNHMTW
jgi:IBR domain, a half RING-finger domain